MRNPYFEYCSQQGIDPDSEISKLFWSDLKAEEIFGSEMIWVRSYKREILAFEKLIGMLRQFPSLSSEWDALHDGALSLHREACESCRKAMKRGMLLMLVVA